MLTIDYLVFVHYIKSNRSNLCEFPIAKHSVDNYVDYSTILAIYSLIRSIIIFNSLEQMNELKRINCNICLQIHIQYTYIVLLHSCYCCCYCIFRAKCLCYYHIDDDYSFIIVLFIAKWFSTLMMILLPDWWSRLWNRIRRRLGYRRRIVWTWNGIKWVEQKSICI